MQWVLLANVEEFQPGIARKRQNILLAQQLVSGKQLWVEQDAGKGAVLFLEGVPIMHLACVYHQAIIFLEQHPVSVDSVIHFAFPDMEKFDIFMPVAERAPVRVGSQMVGFYVQRDANGIILDDF